MADARFVGDMLRDIGINIGGYLHDGIGMFHTADLQAHTIAVFKAGKLLIEKGIEACLTCKIFAQTMIEFLVEYGVNNLGMAEYGFVFVQGLQVDGNQTGHPTLAMDDIRRPAKLLDGLKHTLAEEDGTLIVVFEERAVVVVVDGLAVEVIFVVKEVHLHLGLRNGCDLDNQRVVVVVDRNVDTRKPDHFVQAVPAFIDHTEPRYQNADFMVLLLDGLRQKASNCTNRRIFDERGHLRTHKEDFLLFLHTLVERSYKIIAKKSNICALKPLKIAFLRHFSLAQLKIFYYSRSVEPALQQLRTEGPIGFVPTMGALHEGHLALVQAAIDARCLPVVSIFVNPRQFNNPEDLRLYPRTTAEDLALLVATGCRAVFLPEPSEVYPAGASIPDTRLGELENRFEGSFRPGHFRGVSEVLYRLFSLVKPDFAFFGEKDFQQCAVVETLLQAHFNNISLQRVPTLRESNGLAMSSRNRRLSTSGREKAAGIFKALQQAADGRQQGLPPNAAIAAASHWLHAAGIETEYFALADPQSLEPLNNWPDGNAVLLFAGYLEGVRLIDNLRC